MTTKTTTMRQSAHDKIEEVARAIADSAHVGNYTTWYVGHDGVVWHNEEVSESSDVIDGDADHFCALPHLAKVGTGSVACNCDDCRLGSTDERDCAWEEAEEYARQAHKVVDGLERGYFYDEREAR